MKKISTNTMQEILKDPVINENGEIVVTDSSIFGDYVSQAEVEAALQRHIKDS